jgi:hypothetical protein
MVHEFFNPSLGSVYRLDERARYDAFLPTVAVESRADGTVFDASGRVVNADYVLMTCRTPVDGEIVAESLRKSLRLVSVGGPVRLSAGKRCSSRP